MPPDDPKLLIAKSDAMLNALFRWYQDALKEALRLTGEIALRDARIAEIEANLSQYGEAAVSRVPDRGDA